MRSGGSGRDPAMGVADVRWPGRRSDALDMAMSPG